MQDKKVTITDSRIYYKDTPSSIVMDEISKDLMKAYSEVVCENGGQILDIGFGLGYSADFIYEIVGNYSCIEINPQVYKNALKWAEGKENVNIYLGDWTEVIPILAEKGIKYDGIFMDTYKDRSYGKFEEAAKSIANQNCCLSIYECARLRKDKPLNKKLYYFKKDSLKSYPKFMRDYKEICWTYYVGKEFVSIPLFRKFTNIIPKDLCNELLEDNINDLKDHEASAIVKGVVHSRVFGYVPKIKSNQRLNSIISEKIFKEFNNVNFNNLDISLFRYNEGEKYDRHVMTAKGMPLSAPEQLCMSIDIYLNDNFKGGNLIAEESWERSKEGGYAVCKIKQGDVYTYKPWQHMTYDKVEEGTKYQIVIQVKNKDLKKKPKSLI